VNARAGRGEKMTEVPKIVYDRLGAAERDLQGRDALDPAHPNADLLTAFAEQALSPTEREGVFGHLALCGGCRELVALALPAEEVAAETAPGRPALIPAKAARSWRAVFAVPSLRWAALAAGIAIGCALLLVRPGTLNQAKLPAANPQIATAALPASAQQIASSPSDQSGPADGRSSIPRAVQLDPPFAGEIPKSERPSSKKIKAGRIASHTPQAPIGVAAETAASAGNNTAVRRPLPAEDTLMAKNDAPPIERAKPALQGSESAQPNVNLDVTWEVAGGVLQRSLDGGQTWQTAVRADHPLLCMASRKEDIWTGGRAGTLFHSADGGVTWVQVHPSISAQPLTLDVVHIELRDALEIAVSTSDLEVWSSPDGGKTWDKK
jgi:hypothetical protein